MKIIVDREACIGAASCVALASKTFTLDQESKSEVINVQEKIQTARESSGTITVGPETDTRAAILEAARSCPTNAIRVLDDDGTPLV